MRQASSVSARLNAATFNAILVERHQQRAVDAVVVVNHFRRVAEFAGVGLDVECPPFIALSADRRRGETGQTLKMIARFTGV